MKLSIIIVSYNTKKVLAGCLNSIFYFFQKVIHEKEFEIIIVDNASKDGTVNMIEKQYKQVIFIKNQTNVGFGKANNIGVKRSKGTYILFLNPDTVLTENSLTYLINYMDINPKVGITTCKVLLTNGEIDDASHRGFPTPWRAFSHFIGLGKIFPHSLFLNGYHLAYQKMDDVHEIEACAGAFLLIRKNIGEKIKWFDEDYFWYGEDLDLCYRVKNLGYKIMFIPQISITHIKGAASGIKRHSQHLSKVDEVTQKKIIYSRFSVMKIFYQKHYAQKYPVWVTKLVLFGINIKQKFSN